METGLDTLKPPFILNIGTARIIGMKFLEFYVLCLVNTQLFNTGFFADIWFIHDMK
jgi:hypothetical protein